MMVEADLRRNGAMEHVLTGSVPRVLLTGAAGFTARHLAPCLRGAGYEVVIVSFAARPHRPVSTRRPCILGICKTLRGPSCLSTG